MRRRQEPEVTAVTFDGAATARPTPAVLDGNRRRGPRRHRTVQPDRQHRSDPVPGRRAGGAGGVLGFESRRQPHRRGTRAQGAGRPDARQPRPRVDGPRRGPDLRRAGRSLRPRLRRRRTGARRSSRSACRRVVLDTVMRDDDDRRALAVSLAAPSFQDANATVATDSDMLRRVTMRIIVPHRGLEAAKTRLAPSLSPEERIMLASQLLQRVLKVARQVRAGCRRHLTVARPGRDRRAVRRAACRPARHGPQRGAGAGPVRRPGRRGGDPDHPARRPAEPAARRHHDAGRGAARGRCSRR